MRKRTVLALLIIGVVSAFAWHQSIGQVPDGQPPLVTLDLAAVDALRSEFNAAADRVRIIVLLAPT
jgi:hypothetical protein